MSLFHCAGVIANAEGLSYFDLPEDIEQGIDLASLDKRTRWLESHLEITPPPPMMQMTPEALAWRVNRVHQTVYGVVANQDLAIPLFGDATDVSLEIIKAVVDSIGREAPEWPSAKVNDEDEALCIVLQKLCHLAGQRRLKLQPVGGNRFYVYSVAMHLAQQYEGQFRNFTPVRRREYPTVRSRSPSPSPRIIRRSSSPQVIDRRSFSDRRDDFYPARRRIPQLTSRRPFGPPPPSPRPSWFSKLAFWRTKAKRRARDYDSSSERTLSFD
ncbi:hypothetical protein PT974_03157 [Cladobotryum mycophilum]|uniref:Uncharacterized protein n=1 Tax=Cladobotryum mycophilum TaxID=491253 RepID=A0ABR0SRV3_9HYPO